MVYPLSSNSASVCIILIILREFGWVLDEDEGRTSIVVYFHPVSSTQEVLGYAAQYIMLLTANKVLGAPTYNRFA